MSTTNHPLDGVRKWGVISFYLLPFLQIHLLPYLQNMLPPNTWVYMNTVWVQLVRLAQLTTSKTALNVFTSLPLLLACWIDGLILLYPLLDPDSEQHIMLRVFLGFLIILVMTDVSASVIQCFSNNYCSNWYMCQIVRWLKNSVVDKRIRPWTVSNSLMNISILLLAFSSVRVFFWYGALSISLVATICVVFGKKDDMGVLDGLQTCYYMSTLTLFTTDNHGVLVSFVSLIVLLFLVLCTVGVAPDPKLKALQDEERRLEEGRYGKGDENGDVESLRREISGLREELHDVKAYAESIRQCYCQQSKSSNYKKPQSTLVVGKTGAYLIRGFSNFTRNCYFNAVVQVLLSIAPLRVPFMKLNLYDRPLTRAVKDLFIKTSLPSVSDCNTALGNLYVCFCAKAPNFSDGRDQDSHEFLVCLLQLLHEEEEMSAWNFPISPPRLVYSIFGGRVLTTTSCKSTECEYTNEEGEPFLQMFLPIPGTGDLSRASMIGNTGTAVSLSTCLDQYIQLEFIPEWRCHRCFSMGGNISTGVIRAPLILTIIFKRFSADNKKINDHVFFEESFDLRPYTDPRYVGGDKLEYHLIGVVVHEGSVHKGHCFAYVRGDKSGGSEEDNNDFTWYCLNDLIVREVSLQQVLQSQAYMLFYEKKDSSVKEGLSYAKTSSAFGPPATPSGYYGNRPDPGLANYRIAPINHGSSKQRHRRSRSSTWVW